MRIFPDFTISKGISVSTNLSLEEWNKKGTEHDILRKDIGQTLKQTKGTYSYLPTEVHKLWWVPVDLTSLLTDFIISIILSYDQTVRKIRTKCIRLTKKKL